MRLRPKTARWKRCVPRLALINVWISKGLYLQSPQLLLRQFPPRIQLIEIQDRIEDQGVTALRLGAPEGIDREEQDVTLFVWDVNHCGVLRDLVTGFEQPRDQ